MPEGPEIRIAADRIHRAIAGRPCTSVHFAFNHLRSYEEKLSGVSILEVTSRGKAMLTRFENGWSIYSHNQLYGVWRIIKAGQLPNTGRQLRLALHNQTHSALLYSASDIEVLPSADEGQHPFLRRLGPDLLDDATRVENVLERLMSSTFRKRSLGALLLDQSFVAGLGNYLRSEILFLAGTMPQKRPIDCDLSQLERIAQNTVFVTRQSYETKGITNDLNLVAALKEQGLTRSKYRHWVFAREARPCWRCGTPIESMTAGGRRLFYCPHCQNANATSV